MLIITEDDVNKVLTMPVCIEAMQTAFTELANGIAAYFPRARYKALPDVNELGSLLSGQSANRFSWLSADRLSHWDWVAESACRMGIFS